MKCREKVLLGFLVLCSAGKIAADCTVTPYFSPRNQGTAAARQMVGWEELINVCDRECWYAAFAGVAEYSQTFNSRRICECLFGSSDAVTSSDSTTCSTSCESECSDCSIVISGSCVEDRGSNDWLADYFGLPSDFQSTVKFSPRVQTFVADLEFYWGLDQWVEGLYFRLNLPIAYTRWDLRVCEAVSEAGENQVPIGYFSSDLVPRSQLLNQATDFFAGRVPDLATGQTPEITFQPLRYGKWNDCGVLKKTRLADVEMVLGYNFVCNECGFFGLNLRSMAPTGNRPEGCFLFEPIVGNGHHWTIGVGLNAHYVFWRSQCNDSAFGVYLDANISHLFKTCQTRTFDLCAQGDNSRYMLAQKLEEATLLYGSNADPAPIVTGDATQSNFQFANEFAPVANLTASNIDVKVSVEGNLALKFAYTSDCGFAWDLGYEFWGRSCEKFSNPKCSRTDLSNWALKGDAYVYGFNAGAPVPLGATENDATIHTGTGTGGVDDGICENSQNLGIDNANLAFVVTAAPTIVPVTVAGGGPQTRTSIQPITLDQNSINFASNRGISNKLFTNLSYTWKDCETWKPFVGIGASAEFGQRCSNSCDTDNDCNTSSCETSSCNTGCDSQEGSCVSCAFSQWSVWLKGGFSYN